MTLIKTTVSVNQSVSAKGDVGIALGTKSGYTPTAIAFEGSTDSARATTILTNPIYGTSGWTVRFINLVSTQTTIVGTLIVSWSKN